VAPRVDTFHLVPGAEPGPETFDTVEVVTLFVKAGHGREDRAVIEKGFAPPQRGD